MMRVTALWFGRGGGDDEVSDEREKRSRCREDFRLGYLDYSKTESLTQVDRNNVPISKYHLID